MIRAFCYGGGNGVEMDIGMCEFRDRKGEDWRVRCGWMYYTEKYPKYGLKRLKIPPYISVKKSAILYL